MAATAESVLDKFCEYVAHNWNASLGYGHDEETLRYAAESNAWFLEALDMSADDFIKYFGEVQDVR